MTLEEQIAQLKQERDEARDWVRRLTNEKGILTCAYCGQEYPPGTPAANDDSLTTHIKICPKHPMRELEARFKRWRNLAYRMQAVLKVSIRQNIGPDRDFAQRTLDELEELLKEK